MKSPSRSGLFLFFLLFTLSPSALAEEDVKKQEKLDLKELFEKGIPESPFISVVTWAGMS